MVRKLDSRAYDNNNEIRQGETKIFFSKQNSNQHSNFEPIFIDYREYVFFTIRIQIHKIIIIMQCMKSTSI